MLFSQQIQSVREKVHFLLTIILEKYALFEVFFLLKMCRLGNDCPDKPETDRRQQVKVPTLSKIIPLK